MIIFYNKQTGLIFGTIAGRVHDKKVLENRYAIQPEGLEKKYIGRYVVPFVPRIEEVEIPVEKIVEERKGGKIVPKQIIEKKKEKRAVELMPTGFMKEIYYEFEEGKKTPLKHKFVLDKNGKPTKIVKQTKADLPVPQKPNSVETILIDLTRDLDDIYKDFGSNTKRFIKKAEKNKLTFHPATYRGIEDFEKLLKEVETRKKFYLKRVVLRDVQTFMKSGHLLFFVRTEEGEPIAGAIIASLKPRFLYSLAAVNQKGRDLHGGDWLVWNIMKEAKGLGYEYFDFGGLFTEGATDYQKKLNIFKKRWGGKSVPSYPTIKYE